ILVFLFAIPFWILGAVVEPENLPINLPLSTFAVLAPIAAALILTYRDSGRESVYRLLRSAVDYRHIENKVWYLPIFLLMPLIAVLTYILLVALGRSLPTLQFPIGAAVVMLVVFFIGGIAEELGWQGYLFERIQLRGNALEAALIVGVVWAIWHIIPFIQTHNPPEWIAWQCGFTVGLRVLIVWVYNNTGKSLFAAVSIHAVYNLSAFLFPNLGSHYDPATTCLLTFIVVGIAVYFWGAPTLAHWRFAHKPR
ncbi:MAG: CPBP family intramembrane metalloprotease, partial [Anaerolineae bacterium]|nr:CPBP family intramembrane metalloprotease [Anaerolineae bacterium]